MTSIPRWNEDPDAWSFVILGAYQLPGVATSVNVKKKMKLDVKTPPGSNVSTLSFKGYDSADVDITLLLWAAVDWDNFLKVMPAIEPQKGKKAPDVLRIISPQANCRGVFEVVVESIDGPSFKAQGQYEVKLKCIEYTSKDRDAAELAKRRAEFKKASDEFLGKTRKQLSGSFKFGVTMVDTEGNKVSKENNYSYGPKPPTSDGGSLKTPKTDLTRMNTALPRYPGSSSAPRGIAPPSVIEVASSGAADRQSPT